jgi:hypothetical protein
MERGVRGVGAGSAGDCDWRRPDGIEQCDSGDGVEGAGAEGQGAEQWLDALANGRGGVGTDAAG